MSTILQNTLLKKLMSSYLKGSIRFATIVDSAMCQKMRFEISAKNFYTEFTVSPFWITMDGSLVSCFIGGF